MLHIRLAALTLLVGFITTALGQEPEPFPEPPSGIAAMSQLGVAGGIPRLRSQAAPVAARRDLKRYASVLGLNDEQRDAAAALLDGYLASVQAYRQRVEASIENLRRQVREQPPEFKGLFTMRDLFLSLTKEKEDLDAAFLADLRSLLRPDQEGNWARFERMHRRERGLRSGILSGERVDLVEIVEQMDVDEATRAAMRPLLESYEDELYRAIGERERVRKEVAQRTLTLRYDGQDLAIGTMVEDLRSAATVVRDINRRYARQVREGLPEQRREGFDRVIELASYPDVYRPTLAAQSLQAAAGVADLDQPQRDAIGALAARYEQDAEGLNRQIAAMQDEIEAKFTPAQMAGRFPDQDLKDQKKALDKRTLEQLRELLTEPQRKRLPKPQERPEAPRA
jgi:hypothetical protein